MNVSRVRVAAALVLVATAATSGGVAQAHPLGNFTVNHLDVVRVSRERVDVRWILDQAEIPTFQERGRPPADILADKRAVALRGLHLTVDGRRVGLRVRGPGRITFPPGQGGLRLTRVELLLSASAVGARAVSLRDSTFEDRLGWHGMLAAPGEGTAVRSDQPATEPTQRLRRYPVRLLESPADQRSISLTVSPGDGTVSAPREAGGALQTTRKPLRRRADERV